MFSGCENLTNITFSELNLTHLERMTGTFMNCISLKNISLSFDNVYS